MSVQDTSKNITNKYHKMLMNKSGTECLYMGARMEEAAREMVLASISDEKTESEKKTDIFLRYYKNDFSDEEITKIIKHLKTH